MKTAGTKSFDRFIILKCSYNSSVSFHQTHNSKTVKTKTDSSSFHAIQPALKWLDEALGMARCSFCRGSGNKI